jgi:hypothetical protein
LTRTLSITDAFELTSGGGIGEKISMDGGGAYCALATSRVCIPAIIETDSAKMSVSVNAVLFISIIFYVS